MFIYLLSSLFSLLDVALSFLPSSFVLSIASLTPPSPPFPSLLFPSSSLFPLPIVKSPLFHGGQSADERSYLMNYVASMPTRTCISFICPRLFAIHELPSDTCIQTEDGRVFLPKALSLCSSSIRNDGIYILDDARHIYMWIGDDVHPDTISEIFGVDATHGYHPSQLQVSREELDDPSRHSTRVLELLYQLRKDKPSFPNLALIARTRGEGMQATLDETFFFRHMIEDKGGLHSYSKSMEEAAKKDDVAMMNYVDYLCHIHKRIQDKFY